MKTRGSRDRIDGVRSSRVLPGSSAPASWRHYWTRATKRSTSTTSRATTTPASSGRTSRRHSTLFGPRRWPDMAFQRFVEALACDRPLHIFGSGHQSRDFTYVDDVAAATIAALGAPSPVYNIGGGTPTSVNEAVALLQQLTEKQGRGLHHESPRRR